MFGQRKGRSSLILYENGENYEGEYVTLARLAPIPWPKSRRRWAAALDSPFRLSSPFEPMRGWSFWTRFTGAEGVTYIDEDKIIEVQGGTKLGLGGSARVKRGRFGERDASSGRRGWTVKRVSEKMAGLSIEFGCSDRPFFCHPLDCQLVN